MYKTGIVLGSFNMPDFIKLQIAAIRANCGSIPIFISDNISNPDQYGSLKEIVKNDINCVISRNFQSLNWPGGDLACYWKGVTWANAIGLDVLYKLSQRCVIDIPNWDQTSAAYLCESNCGVLGRNCSYHGWAIRTEMVGMSVRKWYTPEILHNLFPKNLDRGVEYVIEDILKTKFHNQMLPWTIMSPARPQKAPGILFREANSDDDYKTLAVKWASSLVFTIVEKETTIQS
jgi:hypothetical protein